MKKKTAALGKDYQDGDIIVREGESGNCMFEIQSGKVEIFRDKAGQEVKLAVLGPGDFFGEMSIFEREVRSATVRAQGPVRALTVDKKTLLTRISADPTLAFRLLEKLSGRIRELDKEIVQLRETC
jgi:CRP/FNR family cyclic AMP-dependent transcriptional regulator